MRTPLLVTIISIYISVFQSHLYSAEFEIPHPDLKAITIDSVDTESFLSVRLDTEGNLFAGCREALFVYEANDSGFAPRKLLYTFPKDSWLYDLEIRGNDIYVMTNLALYVIKDARVKRDGLKPERLIWGLPDFHPHQCFHGLAFGPDGWLYMSMGDLLVWYGDFSRPDHWGHWTFFCQPDDTRVPFTGVGGVLRCKPDGSQLEVVARGTRNSCGLVFDNKWNLFTHDNDHEGLPTEFVPSRLLHVVPGADFGWPRGWMPTMTPDRKDLLVTMNQEMGRGVPVGQSYYDETYLPEQYRNSILLARWGTRALSSYPIKASGATFKAKEQILLQGLNQTRPVGVTVGRGGRIFVTLAEMAHNEGSPVYQSDLVMITRKDDDLSKFKDAVDITQLSGNELPKLTSINSTWLTQRVVVELNRRSASDDGLQADLVKAWGESPSTDLLWALSMQLKENSLRGEGEIDSLIAATLLHQLVKVGDTQTKIDSIRILGELFQENSRDVIADELSTKNSGVQLAAITSLNKIPNRKALKMIARLAGSEDSYLRQAAAYLLAKQPTEVIEQSLSSRNTSVRLGGVLAAGFKLTIPPALEKLDADLPLQDWPNEAVYKVAYDGAEFDVRKLGPVGIFTVAEHWAAKPPSKSQEKLFELLLQRLDDDQEVVRLQAAHFLGLLKDDRSEPKVLAVQSDSERKRLTEAPLREIPRVWSAGPFQDDGQGFKKVHPPEIDAVDVAASYDDGGVKVAWEQIQKVAMFDFHKMFGDADDSSRYVYFRFESPKRQQVLLLPGSDDGMRVWVNGKLEYEVDQVRGGLPLQDVIFVQLEAGSNDVLIRIRNVIGEHNLYLHYRALDNVSVTLPEKLDIASLAQRLKDGQGAKLNPELLDVEWSTAIDKGDVARGEKLFSADGIGCAKCHGIKSTDAAGGGPSLAESRKRFTVAYLVESVLLPSKKIAPVFKSSAIITSDGRVVTGLVVSDTAEAVEVLTLKAERIKIAKADIEMRKELPTSPMPAGLIKDPQELMDLLAYLLAK